MANILVVDDYVDTAQSMATWLKLLGHDVQIAFDGYQAIEIARSQRPSYVLLDIGLPGLDGYRVASTLRRELAEPIVIVAITGYGQEADRHRALMAGFDLFLVKPIDDSALISLLSESSTGSNPPVQAGLLTESMVRDEHAMPVVRRQVEITNPLGLHLRAADKFVRLAQQFQANVKVACEGREASGRSILDLTMLAAPCGSRLELGSDGLDAEAALDALAGLVVVDSMRKSSLGIEFARKGTFVLNDGPSCLREHVQGTRKNGHWSHEVEAGRCLNSTRDD